MQRTARDVDRFLTEAGDHTAALHQLDRVISQRMAGLDRALWTGVMWGGTDQEIIGYGLIEHPRPGGQAAAWFLIGLARQSAHYSIYVNATLDGRSLAQVRADRLGRVRVGAAAVTFREPGDLDLAGLAEVVGEARALSAGVQ